MRLRQIETDGGKMYLYMLVSTMGGRDYRYTGMAGPMYARADGGLLEWSCFFGLEG